MISIFLNLLKQCLGIFVVDFSIYEDSVEDCLTNLEKLLRGCQDKHLTLN